VARVSSGGFEPFLEPTDVAAVVQQVAEQQSRDPDHPPIRWQGQPVSGLLDPGRLKSALLAFAEALVWWGSDGPIEVTAAAEGARLHLVASREAAALDAEAVEALFAARAPGTGGGSKIGLFVSRRVAEAQGGRAWGEHRGGRLSFHLDLPLSGPTASAP
ncbi:MAG TPA: hypothetical protein VFQ40_02695, partial [Actinomycetota bacterium]|nr:hypothetical protein [Actinomycetota bacterium]